MIAMLSILSIKNPIKCICPAVPPQLWRIAIYVGVVVSKDVSPFGAGTYDFVISLCGTQ
jgi:hypothetical protein